MRAPHTIHPRWVRLGRVLVVFLAAGWLAGALVLATDEGQSLPGTLLHGMAMRSALAAVLAGLVWGPALAWTRLRWPAGVAIGLLVGLTALYVFFFLWPHGWQAGRLNAWKSAGLFARVYWRFLVPIAGLGGAVAAAWARRSVRPPRWALVDRDEP